MNWQERRARLLKTGPGRLLLRVLSLGYGLAVAIRGLLYDLGLLRSRRVGVKVVSIGNLTAGGTGKTPAAVLAALTLRRHGGRVAILSRGYGRPEKSREVCVLDEGSALTWRQCGDEPWMMRRILKGQGVPILVCPDRTRAAMQAEASLHSRVVVLDDGFQHRALRRDLDVVLVNAVDPFAGRRLLPFGGLREPLRALRRAHLIMLTHVDLAAPERLEALRAELRGLNPKAPLLESLHRPDFLFDVKNERRLPLGHLAGRATGTLAGIAAPAQFEDQLARHVAAVAQKWRYPDHHRYAPRELAAISHLLGDMPLVTTFKDLVRFPDEWRLLLAGEVYALSIRLEIVKGEDIWNDALLKLSGT